MMGSTNSLFNQPNDSHFDDLFNGTTISNFHNQISDKISDSFTLVDSSDTVLIDGCHDDPYDTVIIISRNSDIQKICHKYHINYPVRLHTIRCHCDKICSSIRRLDTNIRHSVVYTIEKMYPDKRYESYPNRIHICDTVRNSKIFDSKKFLGQLFGDDLYYKKFFVKEYFEKYSDKHLHQTIRTRQLLDEIPSVCMCNSFTQSVNNLNAGIVLLGDKHQLEPISLIFNQRVRKTEFSELFVYNTKDIDNISHRNSNHTLKRLKESKKLNKLSDYHTLLGNEINVFNREILSFSFGKREWYVDHTETSFECAKRELFEEFNIQISSNIFKYNKKLLESEPNKLKHIIDHESVLFFVYLPHILYVTYDVDSDTIFLDTEPLI
ncbi:putative divergent nudix hydrolase [Acanthamoeba polyphaga mimivirus]|uniref:Putative divergent NUDIX hydrolase n=1 Tax=Acanthamoeba polyphaga mimivirus TaxID=212035 RepID=A0A0G2Y6A1_MIMIV|nr:putative divergent NUDIX hydrolase [Acanthamoeba castellanii mamavirus]AKI79302.1 putative divergent NUDIX hydrolase [Acanthamoeba polyphaga mimivirus]UMZ07947.1 putative divergent nudix hydrolase [Acanthamoeba polyphaga mimivirus]